MADLVLHVKDCYFQDVKAGRKPDEFRKRTPYWIKRLVGRKYDRIVYMSGYPKRTETHRILIIPYRGYKEQTITHEHFGDKPEAVFAIRLTGDAV